jgi:hypothetical protein
MATIQTIQKEKSWVLMEKFITQIWKIRHKKVKLSLYKPGQVPRVPGG